MIIKYYLYIIINTISGREYVGITKNYLKRFKEHKYKSSNPDIREDMLKYGTSIFIFKVLCIGIEDFIVDLEHRYLTKYLILENMYNKNTGGSCNGGTFGENHGRTNLTNEQVHEIRSKYPTGEYTYDALAKEYNITPSSIGKIIRNVNWKLLDSTYSPVVHPNEKKLGKSRDLVTVGEVKLIRELYATGKHTYITIAGIFNNRISKSGIGKIVRKERWRYV